MNHLRGIIKLSSAPNTMNNDVREWAVRDLRMSARYWAHAAVGTLAHARRLSASGNDKDAFLTAIVAGNWWGMALAYWRYARLALRGLDWYSIAWRECHGTAPRATGDTCRLAL